jgi:hypothetical protein
VPLLAVFASRSHPRFQLLTCSGFGEGIAPMGTGTTACPRSREDCTAGVSLEGILKA